MRHLFIELADTAIKRECGLMDRKYLHKDGGMLFKFHYPTFASFWMKNTYIPLDIAFLNDNGKILQIESMIPLSTKAVYSNYQCKYALEVNKGWFAKNGITVGSIVGGEGVGKYRKTAQSTPPIGMPPSPQNPNVPLQDPNVPLQDPNALPQPKPDIMLNLTKEQRFKNGKGKKFIIMYKKKDGYDLPPIVISPPPNNNDEYILEPDENGKANAIVKAFDMFDGEIKSFLIDNIKTMENKK